MAGNRQALFVGIKRFQLPNRKPCFLLSPSYEDFGEIEGRKPRGVVKGFLERAMLQHILWAACRASRSRKTFPSKLRADLSANHYAKSPQLEYEATAKNTRFPVPAVAGGWLADYPDLRDYTLDHASVGPVGRVRVPPLPVRPQRAGRGLVVPHQGRLDQPHAVLTDATRRGLRKEDLIPNGTHAAVSGAARLGDIGVLEFTVKLPTERKEFPIDK